MGNHGDLLRGALESLVLEAIDKGATYGYAIARSLEELSQGELVTKEGSLYPALHRLEKQGLLKARWQDSPQGRPRKHYQLTGLGRKHLAAQRDAWSRFSRVVNRILGVDHA